MSSRRARECSSNNENDFDEEALIRTWADPHRQIKTTDGLLHRPISIFSNMGYTCANQLVDFCDEVERNRPVEEEEVLEDGFDVTDPKLRKAIEDLDCVDRAQLFSAFVRESHKEEIVCARSKTGKVILAWQKDFATKVTRAQKKYYDLGVNEPIVFKTTEAMAVYEGYMSSECRLRNMDKVVRLLNHSVSERNRQIDSLTDLTILLQRKVLDFSPSAYKNLYNPSGGPPVFGPGTPLTEQLKMHLELQALHVDMQDKMLAYAGSLNQGAFFQMGKYDEFLEEIFKEKKSCTAHLPHFNSKANANTWQNFLKEVDSRKQACLEAADKVTVAQIKSEILRGSQDWALFTHVIRFLQEVEPEMLDLLTEQVYGDKAPIFPNLRGKNQVGTLKAHLKGMTPLSKGKTSRKSVPRIDVTAMPRCLKDYVTPKCDGQCDCCDLGCDISSDDDFWMPVQGCKKLYDALARTRVQNNELLMDLQKSENHRYLSAQAARRVQQQYDSLLGTTKIKMAKAEAAQSRLKEWPDSTLKLLNMKTRDSSTEQAKLDKITAVITTLQKEKDRLTTTKEKLSEEHKKMVLTKDKAIDELAKELARAVESKASLEESLKKQIESLEITSQSKDSEIAAAKKLVTKTKDESEKQAQKHSKELVAVKKVLASKEADINVMALDLDTAKSTAKSEDDAIHEKLIQEKTAELEATRKERDEYRSSWLSTRTNRQVEADMVRRAVRDAVAPKDAQIQALEQQKLRLVNGRIEFDRERDRAIAAERERIQAEVAKLTAERENLVVQLAEVSFALRNLAEGAVVERGELEATMKRLIDALATMGIQPQSG